MIWALDKWIRGVSILRIVSWVIPPAELPDDSYPFILTTGRVLYHDHTGTMTMRTDGLNMLSPECFVEISDADAVKLGINIEVAKV